MRAEAKTHARQYVRRDPEDAPEYTETALFQAYCDAIRALISDGPMTIRAIHEKCGYELQHLTYAALASIEAEDNGQVPAKWALRTWWVKEIKYMAHFRPDSISERQKARRPDGWRTR
jgi:hypothetical protein